MKLTIKSSMTAPCLMLCIGILLIVFGVLRGEAETVYEKAIRICLECVGIG